MIPRLIYKPVISSENPRTTAWVNAVVAAGGTVSSGRRTLVNTFLDGLVTDGLDSILSRVWLFAAENTQSALIDVFNANTGGSVVASPTFTTDRGYTMNGTTQYFNTGSTSAGTQNSSLFGFATRTNKSATDTVEMGTSVSGGTAFMCNVSMKWSDGNNYFALNDGNGDGGRTGPTNTIGIYLVSRTGSTLATLYKDGSSFATNGQTSTGVPNLNYYIGAGQSEISAAQFFSPCQFSVGILGAAGANSTQAGNLNTRLQTYLTAVGA